jgi:hypothetical protein
MPFNLLFRLFLRMHLSMNALPVVLWGRLGSPRPGRTDLIRVRPPLPVEQWRHQSQSSGAGRVRTDDIQLAKLALSQLSYSP